MKKINLALIVLLLCGYTHAQTSNSDTNPLQPINSNEISLLQKAEADSTWNTGGVFGLNFGQTALVNWAGGGVNSVAIGGLFNHFRNYNKGKWSWDNELDLAYGMLFQGENEGIKTDDKIDFSTKVGRDLKGPWYLAFLLNFRSQFTEGFADPFAPDSSKVVISKFMAPAYGLASLGIDYKPSKRFTALISPMTAKFTIVNDDQLANAGAYGVTPAVYDDALNIVTDGEKLRTQFGAYAKAQYKTKIAENVNLMSKIDLFADYETITFVDINWEMLLDMKVNEFISATIGTQLLYDHDVKIARDLDTDNPKIGPTTQFKEVLNIGFTYKF